MFHKTIFFNASSQQRFLENVSFWGNFQICDLRCTINKALCCKNSKVGQTVEAGQLLKNISLETSIKEIRSKKLPALTNAAQPHHLNRLPSSSGQKCIVMFAVCIFNPKFESTTINNNIRTNK